MKILVTGSDGFIGKHVVSYLTANGHDVVTLDMNQAPDTGSQEYFQMNISDPVPIKLRQILYQTDACIHLAWGSLNDFNAKDHLSEYPEIHFHFLKNIIEAGLKNIIVLGTCLEYGLREGELHEEAECKPVTTYGEGKNKLRKMLEKLRVENQFALSWIRLFYLYGKGQSEKSVLSQLHKAINEGKNTFPMSSGKQIRDYLPVERVAEIISNIALTGKGNGIVNCCSGKGIRILDLVTDEIKRLNSSIEIRPGVYECPVYEPFEFWGSVEKLNSIVNNEKQ